MIVNIRILFLFLLEIISKINSSQNNILNQLENTNESNLYYNENIIKNNEKVKEKESLNEFEKILLKINQSKNSYSSVENQIPSSNLLEKNKGKIYLK